MPFSHTDFLDQLKQSEFLLGDDDRFNYIYGMGDDVETELAAIGFGEAPPAQLPPDSKLPRAA